MILHLHLYDLLELQYFPRSSPIRKHNTMGKLMQSTVNHQGPKASSCWGLPFSFEAETGTSGFCGGFCHLKAEAERLRTRSASGTVPATERKLGTRRGGRRPCKLQGLRGGVEVHLSRVALGPGKVDVKGLAHPRMPIFAREWHEYGRSHLSSVIRSTIWQAEPYKTREREREHQRTLLAEPR